MLFVPTKCIEKLDQIPILDSHKILKETGSMTFGFDTHKTLKEIVKSVLGFVYLLSYVVPGKSNSTNHVSWAGKRGNPQDGSGTSGDQ